MVEERVVALELYRLDRNLGNRGGLRSNEVGHCTLEWKLAGVVEELQRCLDFGLHGFGSQLQAAQVLEIRLSPRQFLVEGIVGTPEGERREQILPVPIALERTGLFDTRRLKTP